MKCPECTFTDIRKNERKEAKNHICVDCGRQFIDHNEPPEGYSNDIKQECLKEEQSVRKLSFKVRSHRQYPVESVY